MKKLLLLSTLLVSIMSCDNQSDETSNNQANTASLPAWNKQLSDKAQLIAQLPDDAVMYIRIPTLWNLLSPKANALQPALQQQANQKQVAALQTQVAQVIQSLPQAQAKLTELFATHQRSPLELAFILPDNAQSPMQASLALGARFDLADSKAVNQLLTEAFALLPFANITQPATDTTPGSINIAMGQASCQYSFTASSQRLLLLCGMQTTAEQLTQLQNNPNNNQHPILKMENRIDTERQGLFAWIDADRIATIADSMLPASEKKGIVQAILASKTFAFGEGVADGKSHFAILAQGKNDFIWDITLPNSKASNIDLYQPEFAFGIQIPDSQWLKKLIEQLDQQNGNSQISDALAQVEQQFSSLVGASLAEYLDAYAGHNLYVADKAGSYWVISKTQKTSLVDLARKASANSKDLSFKTIKMADKTFYEWSTHYSTEEPEQLATIMMLQWGYGFSTQYYIEETETATFIASQPQILLARSELTSDISLHEWLKQHGINANKSALWFSGDTKYAARNNYYNYLSLLKTAGELLNQSIDTTEFPTANSLNLPELSNMGVQVNFNQGEIGLELHYDSHPFEFMNESSLMVSAAVVGMVAAIAIPAYQEYIAEPQAAMHEQEQEVYEEEQEPYEEYESEN